MGDILKSDVFFFVTTICIGLFTLAVVILAAYAVSIMSDVKHVSKKVKEESEEFINDAREMRTKLKEKGGSLLGLLSVIFGKRKKSEGRKKKD